MAITQYIKHFGLIHVWACCIQILCLIWDYKHCTTAQEPVFSMTDWFVKLDSYKVWMIFCTAKVLINCHSSIEIAIVYLHRSFPHIVYTVHMTNSNLIELDCFWDLINPCKLLSFQSLSLFCLLFFNCLPTGALCTSILPFLMEHISGYIAFGCMAILAVNWYLSCCIDSKAYISKVTPIYWILIVKLISYCKADVWLMKVKVNFLIHFHLVIQR